jgi:hypothetical protein
MIKSTRLSVIRPFDWPSFWWNRFKRGPRRKLNQQDVAERAFANRKRRSFADARRDAAGIEYFADGHYRI